MHLPTTPSMCLQIVTMHRYTEQVIIAEAYAVFEEIGAYTLIAGYLRATGTRALLLALSIPLSLSNPKAKPAGNKGQWHWPAHGRHAVNSCVKYLSPLCRGKFSTIHKAPNRAVLFKGHFPHKDFLGRGKRWPRQGCVWGRHGRDGTSEEGHSLSNGP